jgi:hypothetical protein
MLIIPNLSVLREDEKALGNTCNPTIFNIAAFIDVKKLDPLTPIYKICKYRISYIGASPQPQFFQIVTVFGNSM